MKEPIAYLGEHAWAGTLGHLFASLSFAAALLSLVAYFLASRKDDATWTGLGRAGFRVHTLAVLGIIGLLFTMLVKHWFEFDYVWKHSNTAMPMRYILSCVLGRSGGFVPPVDLLARGARQHPDPQGRGVGEHGDDSVRAGAGLPDHHAVGRVLR
ncbi:MAG: hypothetical protein IPN85_12165 [Flavobacteriales bacterium]|nr:hypothetical protein [Flavobacteriales bacterium]